MKFYLSAKWQLKEIVAKTRDYLIEKGHEVPVDWTTRAFARDYGQFKNSGKFAEEEIKAISNTDVLINFSDPKEGVGKYVDFGAGILGNVLKDILGNENTMKSLKDILSNEIVRKELNKDSINALDMVIGVLDNLPSFIYVLGSKTTESQFYFHKNVKRKICNIYEEEELYKTLEVILSEVKIN